jgi:hypothetical protein
VSEILTFRRLKDPNRVECSTCGTVVHEFSGPTEFGSPFPRVERHAREAHGLHGILENRFDGPIATGFERVLVREQPWGHTLRDVVGRIQSTLVMAGVSRDRLSKVYPPFFECDEMSSTMSRLLGAGILSNAASLNPRAAYLVTCIREGWIGNSLITVDDWIADHPEDADMAAARLTKRALDFGDTETVETFVAIQLLLKDRGWLPRGTAVALGRHGATEGTSA